MSMMYIKIFVQYKKHVITVFEHQQNRHFRIPKYRNVFFEITFRNTCPSNCSRSKQVGPAHIICVGAIHFEFFDSRVLRQLLLHIDWMLIGNMKID